MYTILLLLSIALCAAEQIPVPLTTGCYKGSMSYLFIKAHMKLVVKSANTTPSGQVHGVADGSGKVAGINESCKNLGFNIVSVDKGNVEIEGADDPNLCPNKILSKFGFKISDFEMTMKDSRSFIGVYGDHKVILSHTTDC